MRMMRTFILLIAAVLALAGCASANGDDGAGSLTLTGTVTYRERIAMPADAVLTVTLEDVSLADAPAVTLVQTQFPLDGRQVPIPFSLNYPASAVTPGATYAARARITVGDTLRFVTMDHNPVNALNPAPAELLLTAVAPTA